jgi:hypothetical protein
MQITQVGIAADRGGRRAPGAPLSTKNRGSTRSRRVRSVGHVNRKHALPDRSELIGLRAITFQKLFHHSDLGGLLCPPSRTVRRRVASRPAGYFRQRAQRKGPACRQGLAPDKHMISTGTGYITAGTCKNQSVIASSSRLRTESDGHADAQTVNRIDKTPLHRTD